MKIIRWLKKELVFVLFLLLLVILAAAYPHSIIQWPAFIDWRTIASLGGLLMLTAALRQSGAFARLAGTVLVHLHHERLAAFFLLGLTALLSAFLTNDVTLFIVVPLTLSLQDVLHNDLKKLVIFEAIAANTGSALTPIGNPQNLYLWHESSLTMGAFTWAMLPLFVVLLAMLAVLVWLVFPNRPLAIRDTGVKPFDSRMLVVTLVLMAAFLVCMERKVEIYAAVILLALFALFYRRLLFKLDWVLLLLFCVMFIDFQILGQAVWMKNLMTRLLDGGNASAYWVSALLSQVISNVPAAIFMTQFSNAHIPIAYGVNVAGQGLVIGSLANLIALRLLGDRRTWLTFHLYSLPFFALSAFVVYFVIIR